MAALYPDDISLFGAISVPSLLEDFNDLSEEERVIEKKSSHNRVTYGLEEGAE